MEYIGIFQGGGMKGIAYIGALIALEKMGLYVKKLQELVLVQLLQV